MRWTIPLAVILAATAACVHVEQPPAAPARQVAAAPAIPAPAPAPAPATPAPPPPSESPALPIVAAVVAPISADESLARDVAPVLARRCTPCHVPGGKM